jgi:hypothetical protein
MISGESEVVCYRPATVYYEAAGAPRQKVGALLASGAGDREIPVAVNRLRALWGTHAMRRHRALS